jgi:hypothetical protein
MIPAAFLAVLLAGCGLDQAPPPVASPTDVPLPTPVTTTYAVNLTAWYAGLVIHVDTVTAVLRAGTGSVTAELRLENPGPDVATLDAPIRLTSGGQVVEPVRGTTLPDVPAGGSAPATVAFDIDPAFDLGLAAIRIGRTAYHQAAIPLVEGPMSRVSLEPQVFDLSGSAQAGRLLVSVHGAELRADLPDWGLELGPGTLALTITYDARYVGDFGGGFAFTTANIGLLLPDGTTVAAREDGHSAPAVVIGPRKTVGGLQSRFDVPMPGIGLYNLVIRDGSATRNIPLAIAGT